jgi:Ca2+-binding RTX toxin-like protein
VLPTGVENLTLASGAGAINGTGNALDNVITGNQSANVLTGGGGNDTFVFDATFGKDVIADYNPGQDHIQFSAATFATAADIIAHLTDDGAGNAVIAPSSDHTVTIQNITVAALQQHLGDFHIV